MKNVRASSYKAILKIVAVILIMVGGAMIPSYFCALWFRETQYAPGMLISACITLGAGIILFLSTKLYGNIFRAREGYLTVASCWLIASLFGTLPYLLSGYTTSFSDAFFDSAAAFTTTGCLAFDPSGFPKCLLLCKAIFNWMGGMGILIFIISVFPALGINGQVIAKLETPAPTLEKTTIRMTNTARVLYIIYFAFTALEFMLLLPCRKMGVFEALINALSSVSTAGFFCHSEGITYYDSLYVEIVMCVFAVLSSISYLLYNYIIKGKWKLAVRDQEMRTFFKILIISGLLCTTGMFFIGKNSIGTSFRYGFEQVVSFISTSGFTVTDYYVWPSVCQIVLLTIMITGACSSSTGGSMKIVRVMIMFKHIKRGFFKMLHPRAITDIKLNGRSVPPAVVSAISVFVLSYLGMLLLSILILSIAGLDINQALNTAVSALSNTGAFITENGKIFADYANFSPVVKLWLSLLMTIGRLELFTILLLFTPSFWSRKSR